MEYLADAAAHWNRPALTVLSFPVGGDERGAGEIKAGEVELTKGWIVALLQEPPLPLSESDQMLLASAPKTQGLPFAMCSTTTAGPRPQFWLPSFGLLCVGNCITGPPPQMIFPGLAGERKAVNTVSPTPLVRSSPGESEGIEMTGTMVRVMMFQSSLTETGITGWMLSTFWVFFSCSKFKFMLFWNGTLMRLPTGFWASLASSSALCAESAGIATKNVVNAADVLILP